MTFYSEIRCIAQCALQTSKDFWVFLFHQSSQRTSQETHVYLFEFKRSWFVIRDRWIRFVCFVFQGSLLCDRPVLGNNRLVKFASQIFLIFLILVTCKNKATSASFLQQKIFSSSQFPSLFLNSLESFSAKLGEHVIVICINPAFTKMIDGTEKPKIPLKFAIHAAQ